MPSPLAKLTRFLAAAALGTALLASAGRAAPPNTIGGSVAVCDPWNPQRCAQPDAGGALPVTGTFSATLGGFAPATTGTPIAVTTSGVTGTLPAGAVVVATNVGTTNPAYCKLGASATTSDQYISPGGGWFAFTVGASTQLTCITSSSTTTINMVGGSGLPTGTGGGSGGGGGGGAVTMASGAVASGAYSSGSLAAGAGTDGWDVTQGAKADAACGTATGTCSLIALLKYLNTQASSAIPANVNGTVTAITGLTPGVAQTGTIIAANVDVSSIKGTATDVNSGNKSAGTQRTTLATDSVALAAWGHGATGSAVPSGATMMGFSSGGNLTAPSTTAPLPVRPADGTRSAIIDPCEANLQSYANGVITSATTTRIIAPSASNKTYICSILLTASAADNVGIVEGTGGTCGTGTAGVVGGTTAANGPNFTANGGLMMQAGGKVAVAQTAGTNVDFCLITSSAGPLTYSAKYVQAP